MLDADVPAAGGLILNQFEVFLAHAAIRANPVGRHIFPFGPRRNTVIRPSQCFVVNVATYDAFVFSHVGITPCVYSSFWTVRILGNGKLRSLPSKSKQEKRKAGTEKQATKGKRRRFG